jgi:hypothetical protein
VPAGLGVRARQRRFPSISLISKDLRRENRAGAGEFPKIGPQFRRFGRRIALFSRLFSLLHFCKFEAKGGFTQSLQGFFWGRKGRFLTLILSSRYPVAFIKVCLNSKHEN